MSEGPDESELEEIYHIEVTPGPSWPGVAHQRVYGHANADIDVLAGDPHKLLLTRARKHYHVNPDGNATVVFGDHHATAPRASASMRRPRWSRESRCPHVSEKSLAHIIFPTAH
jgi:hypothetical protein